MFTPFEKTGNLEKDDNMFKEMISCYLSKEDNIITTLANASSLFAWYFEDISWIGFYLKEEDELFLGPFQGLPACTKIKMGVGVCGVSAKMMKTLNVADVSTFPSYIACESSVKSELVVPLIKNGEILGVLDADSNTLSRFTDREEKLFEYVTLLISSYF